MISSACQRKSFWWGYAPAEFSREAQPMVNEPTGLGGWKFVVIIITKTFRSMAKTLQIRVEDTLRLEADAVLSEIGLDVPSAVRLFLTKVVQTRSIPPAAVGERPLTYSTIASPAVFGNSLQTWAAQHKKRRNTHHRWCGTKQRRTCRKSMR